MRLAAYKKMINSANELPAEIEGSDYFEDITINPRRDAVAEIITRARLDVSKLFVSEFVDLCSYANEKFIENEKYEEGK